MQLPSGGGSGGGICITGRAHADTGTRWRQGTQGCTDSAQGEQQKIELNSQVPPT